MDVVALAQLGFPNAVATLGTACTPEHVQKLFRFTDSVVFSFDGDAAGRRAARKALDGALPYATDVRTVKFLFLPAEHDPDSYIREFGEDAFAQLRERGHAAVAASCIEAAREGCDLATAEGRAHMATNASPLWTLHARRRAQAPAAGRDRRAGPAGQLASCPGSGAVRAGSPTALSERERSHRNPDAGYRPNSVPQAGRPAAARPGPALQPRRPCGAPAAGRRGRLGGRCRTNCTPCCASCPAPHGPLFAWLDSQLHEHGTPALGRAARRPCTSTRPSALGLEAMADRPGHGGRRAPSPPAELRDLLEPHADRAAQGPGDARRSRPRAPIRPPWSATGRCTPAGWNCEASLARRPTSLEIPPRRYNVGLPAARATAAPPDPANRRPKRATGHLTARTAPQMFAQTSCR